MEDEFSGDTPIPRRWRRATHLLVRRTKTHAKCSMECHKKYTSRMVYRAFTNGRPNAISVQRQESLLWLYIIARISVFPWNTKANVLLYFPSFDSLDLLPSIFFSCFDICIYLFLLINSFSMALVGWPLLPYCVLSLIILLYGLVACKRPLKGSSLFKCRKLVHDWLHSVMDNKKPELKLCGCCNMTLCRNLVPIASSFFMMDIRIWSYISNKDVIFIPFHGRTFLVLLFEFPSYIV